MQEPRRSGWLRRTLIGGSVAVLLLGGGAIAFAASSGTAPANAAQTFLDDVAQHLGIPTATLKSAIQAAETDQVNQAVTNGKLTQSQADTIKSRIQNGQIGRFGGVFGHGGRHGPRGFGGGMMLKPAADYLGLTPQALLTQLQSGKTLAQIADATSGKSSQGLQQYLVSQLQTRLDTAVKNGKMTQTQANQIMQNAQTRIQSLMNKQFQFKDRTQPQNGSGT